LSAFPMTLSGKRNTRSYTSNDSVCYHFKRNIASGDLLGGGFTFGGSPTGSRCASPLAPRNFVLTRIHVATHHILAFLPRIFETALLGKVGKKKFFAQKDLRN
jgi:hypothetical protein